MRSALLVAVAVLGMSCVHGDPKRSNVTHPARADEYIWGGVTCGDLAVGIAVDHREPRVGDGLRWRWALHNRGTAARDVTLSTSADPFWRARLEIFADAATEPLESRGPERPIERMTPGNRGTQIGLGPGQLVALDGGPLVIEPRFRSRVRLRVHFGGAPYSFDCASGEVVLTVK